MTRRHILSLLLSFFVVAPAFGDQIAATTPAEPEANTLKVPTQILKTGINLNGVTVSANTLQLAKSIGLADLLERLPAIRAKADSASGVTLESLAARQDLLDAKAKISERIQKVNLEVDFCLAELTAEQNVYGEVLSTYISNRDKAIARTNALSFISNGGLWALGEAYAVPQYKYPRLSVPSGIISILAGIIPSAASMYTFAQLGGKKNQSEVEPNMLAKIFGYPASMDIEYPHNVWEFLNQVPATQPSGKTRREQLIDRWVADSNISSFTDRSSKDELDVLTASVSRKKGLSIATLSTRQVMLQQLGAEVLKMKRMLMELAMVLDGDKQITAIAPIDEKGPAISDENGQGKSIKKKTKISKKISEQTN